MAHWGNTAIVSGGWQPIETAPKDGSRVMLWIDGGSEFGFWNGRSWDDGDFVNDLGAATHWMPLPPPPEAV